MKVSSLFLALTFAATACVSDSSLHVDNQSDYTIEELYLTGSGNASWGPNRLGGDVLYPNEQLTIGASCGTYDVKFVDETGAACEVDELDLCGNDADWIISNNTCSVFSRELNKEHTPRAPAVRAQQ